MRQYGHLLEAFSSNNNSLNDAIFTMMHHISGDLNRPEALYVPQILKAFSDIWQMVICNLESTCLYNLKAVFAGGCWHLRWLGRLDWICNPKVHWYHGIQTSCLCFKFTWLFRQLGSFRWKWILKVSTWRPLLVIWSLLTLNTPSLINIYSIQALFSMRTFGRPCWRHHWEIQGNVFCDQDQIVSHSGFVISRHHHACTVHGTNVHEESFGL